MVLHGIGLYHVGTEMTGNIRCLLEKRQPLANNISYRLKLPH